MQEKVSTLNDRTSAIEKDFNEFQAIKLEMDAVKEKVAKANYELLQNEMLRDKSAKLENMSKSGESRVVNQEW